jgi:glucan biosynthesis protein C
MRERYYFIDWLRVIAIILVLFFHVGMIFTAEWGWHIKNNQTSYLWLEFNFWLSRFRMPLLFFISGAGCFWALRKRSAFTFIKERFSRLIIPFIFATLVVVPPQIFFDRVFDDNYTGNFLQFYPTIFTTGFYPEGNFHWFHMWFVLYLFAYSVILLPLFLLIRNENILNRLKKIEWLNSLKGVFVMLFSASVLYVFWTSKFSQRHELINDWGYLPYWMSFFVVGYFMSSTETFWEILERNRKILLKLAILFIVIHNYLRWNKIEPQMLYGDQWNEHIFSYFYLCLTPANAWFWLLAAVGYGKKYLNRNHKFLSYANRGIYSFYILHQTIIICIGFYIVNLEESILAKYFFVSIITFVLTVAIYDFIIRPYKVFRFFFGVKELKKQQAEVISTNKLKVEKESFEQIRA